MSTRHDNSQSRPESHAASTKRQAGDHIDAHSEQVDSTGHNLVDVFLPDDSTSASTVEENEDRRPRFSCPACGEQILTVALRCRYCDTAVERDSARLVALAEQTPDLVPPTNPFDEIDVKAHSEPSQMNCEFDVDDALEALGIDAPDRSEADPLILDQPLCEDSFEPVTDHIAIRQFVEESASADPLKDARRPCSTCGQMIAMSAVVCRFCGAGRDRFEQRSGARLTATSPQLTARLRWHHSFLGICTVIATLMTIYSFRAALGSPSRHFYARGLSHLDRNFALFTLPAVIMLTGLCVSYLSEAIRHVMNESADPLETSDAWNRHGVVNNFNLLGWSTIFLAVFAILPIVAAFKSGRPVHRDHEFVFVLVWVVGLFMVVLGIFVLRHSIPAAAGLGVSTMILAGFLATYGYIAAAAALTVPAFASVRLRWLLYRLKKAEVACSD